MKKSHFLKMLTATIIGLCASAHVFASEQDQSEHDALLERTVENPIAIDISLPFDNDHVLQELSRAMPTNVPYALRRLIRGYLNSPEDDQKLYSAYLTCLSKHNIAQAMASFGLIQAAGQAATGLVTALSKPDFLTDTAALDGMSVGRAVVFFTATASGICVGHCVLPEEIDTNSHFTKELVDKIKAEGTLEIFHSCIPLTLGTLTLIIASIAQNSTDNFLIPAGIFSAGGFIGIGTAVGLLVRNYYKYSQIKRRLRTFFTA